MEKRTDVQTVVKETDDEKNGNKVETLLKQVTDRSVEELVKVLIENANEDAALYKDTVFVPEMGVHPVDGKQEKTEL